MTYKIITTLIIGFIGGFFGYRSGISGGILFGAMIFVGLYNIATNGGYVPKSLPFISQVLVGTIIGLSFTLDNIKELYRLMLPTLIIVCGLLLMSIVLGLILNKFTSIDLATALFSTCPGGMSSIALVGEAFNADMHIVMLFHTLRLVAVIIFMPILIKLILN